VHSFFSKEGEKELFSTALSLATSTTNRQMP